AVIFGLVVPALLARRPVDGPVVSATYHGVPRVPRPVVAPAEARRPAHVRGAGHASPAPSRGAGPTPRRPAEARPPARRTGWCGSAAGGRRRRCRRTPP